MPKLRFLIISLIIFVSFSLAGQQRIASSQYYFNQYHENPAYGGLDRSLSITALYKSQWNAINQKPDMIYLGAHIPMYIWKGAIGIEAYNESFGIFRNNYFSGSYNYVIVNSLGLLSIGGRAGLHSLSIDGSIIKTPEGIYTPGGSNHNDPSLENGVTNGISPFFEAGMFFDNKFIRGGFALSQIPSTKINASNAFYSNATHARLFFQYNYNVDNSLIIKPTVSIRTDFIEIQTDINILAEINGNIFGAVGLRGYSSESLDAINMMAGMNLNNNYRISYQFDININELSRVNEGTHELILNYNLNKPIATGLPPKAIYNPRDL